MNRMLLLLFTAFLTVSALAQEPVKILCWNLENFVDPYDDPYVSNSTEDIGEWKGETGLKNLARAILQADADVIALQEVESDRVVRLFLDTFIPEHEYKYYAALPSISWHQNLVIASRIPIGPITSWRELEIYNEVLDRTENKYNSRLMAAEIQVNDDYHFTLVNLHLKAGTDPEDPVWRMEQIKLIHAFLAREKRANPEGNMIILGDMNLVPESPEYNLFVNDGPEPLYDPAKALGFPATHPSRNPSRRLDQVYFNQAMKPEYLAESLAVAQPISAEDLMTVSDHLPLVVSIHPEEK